MKIHFSGVRYNEVPVYHENRSKQDVWYYIIKNIDNENLFDNYYLSDGISCWRVGRAFFRHILWYFLDRFFRPFFFKIFSLNLLDDSVRFNCLALRFSSTIRRPNSRFHQQSAGDDDERSVALRRHRFDRRTRRRYDRISLWSAKIDAHNERRWRQMTQSQGDRQLVASSGNYTRVFGKTEKVVFGLSGEMERETSSDSLWYSTSSTAIIPMLYSNDIKVLHTVSCGSDIWIKYGDYGVYALMFKMIMTFI